MPDVYADRTDFTCEKMQQHRHTRRSQILGHSVIRSVCEDGKLKSCGFKVLCRTLNNLFFPAGLE